MAVKGVSELLSRVWKSPEEPRRTRAWLAARVRVGCFALGLAAATLAARGLHAAVDAGSYERSLIKVLAAEGLSVDPGSLIWLRRPQSPLSLSSVFFLAARDEEPPDLYFGYARTVAGSGVLDVLFLSNLTHSSSAAEGRPLRVGAHLVFPVQLGEVYDALVMLDVRGEPGSLTEGWPLLSRIQNAISNFQETGRIQGFGIRRYPFVPAPESLSMAIRGGLLHVRADGEPIAFDPGRELPVAGAQRVQFRAANKGRPGKITWVVDAVRRLPFVGAEPVEWLEHVVFGLSDRLSRWYHEIVPTDVEAEVRAALTVPTLSPEKRALLTATAPELGLPPPPLAPLLPNRVRGEGEWLPLVDDPFIVQNEHAPPAFFQTFIRVDPERDFARVYITLWDPRQVDLHLVMGTREPESATGETGSGQIPRDPAILSRVVGAFNGGFQALHGEFGMMAGGRVYLPPKPFAATVAVHEDGRVGMGSWPGPGPREWDEELANAQIPEGIASLRQNLTSVVEDGTYNPWERWWWGAAPTWADEQTYIHRSGLCLTGDGFLAYFWGESMGPEELGRAMKATDCVRGMHLDMNSKHTGFEFVRPIPAGGSPAPLSEVLSRPLTQAEFEGAVPGISGFRFRVRKAVTTMTPLRFPRYLGTDPRDFFFLTLRPVLPGPALQVGHRAIPFRSAGLPLSGFPPAFARAQMATTDGNGTWLLRIDPSRAVPTKIQGGLSSPRTGADGGSMAATPKLAVAHLSGPEPVDEGPAALFTASEQGGPRYAIGRPSAGARILVRGESLDETGARAALGVDERGFLVYAEASEADAPYLALRLARAGVRDAVALPPGVRLIFESASGLVAVDGSTPVRPDPERVATLSFVADNRPRASVLFPEVKPRPYRVWGHLQDRRVRYFPTGPPRFRVPEAELSP